MLLVYYLILYVCVGVATGADIVTVTLWDDDLVGADFIGEVSLSVSAFLARDASAGLELQDKKGNTVKKCRVFLKINKGAAAEVLTPEKSLILLVRTCKNAPRLDIMKGMVGNSDVNRSFPISV